MHPTDSSPTKTDNSNTVQQPGTSWSSPPLGMDIVPSAADERSVQTPNHFALTEGSGQAYGSTSHQGCGVEAKGRLEGESNLLMARGTLPTGPGTVGAKAQVGASGGSDAVFNVDPSHGKFVTSISGEAFAGQSVSGSAQQKIGRATFDQAFKESIGVALGGNATVNINPENHSYGAGLSAGAFLGTKAIVEIGAGYGPVQVGVGVGVNKGAGFFGGVNVGVNKGVLDATAYLGGALGLGMLVNANVHIDFNPAGSKGTQPNNALDIAAHNLAATKAGRTEVVFIDAGLPKAGELRTDLLAQRAAGRPILPVTIGPHDDGIALITRTLAQQHDVSAVHLLGHGRDGQMKLGGTALNSQSLRTHTDEVAGWKKALTPDADLLLYGCNVAQTSDGKHLVQDLAKLTGTDVAASSHVVGAKARGGSWNLDVNTGHINAPLAPSLAEQARWQGTLAVESSVPVAHFSSSDAPANFFRAKGDAAAFAELEIDGFRAPVRLLQTSSFDSLAPAVQADSSVAPRAFSRTPTGAAASANSTQATQSAFNVFMRHVNIDADISATGGDSRSDRDPNHLAYGEAIAHGYGSASAEGLHVQARGHFDVEANAFDARSAYSDGTFRGTTEFQVGMSGQGDAVFEADPDSGKFVTSVSGGGFVGEKSSLMLNQDVNGTTFGQSIDQMAGAMAGSNATVNFDPTHGTIGLGGRVNAFAGTSVHTGVNVDTVGAKAGAGVGYMAGVGVIAGGNVGFRDGKLDVNITLGASLGVGLNFDIQLGLDFFEIAEQIHAEEIVEGIGDAAYMVGNTFEDAAYTVGDAFDDAANEIAHAFKGAGSAFACLFTI